MSTVYRVASTECDVVRRRFLPASRLVLLSVLLTISLKLTAQHAASTRASKPSTFAIAGMVLNAETGENLPGAVISIGNARGDDMLESVRAGEDGRFRFEGLSAGKYWLRGEAHGFARQAFDEHDGFFTGIVTGGPVDSEHLVFRLRPDAVITGQIVDEANEPVREAQVMLYRKQMEEGREVTTMLAAGPLDDEGHYRFPHLAPGTYFIVVRARPWYAQNDRIVRPGNFVFRSDETGPNTMVTGSVGEGNSGEEPAPTAEDRTLDVAYPLTYYPGATDQSGATPLVLHAGQRVTADMRLTALPSARLRVRAQGADESEALRAEVAEKIFDGPPQPVQGGSMQSEKGEVDIAGIPPGDYEIQVESFGKNPQSWTEQLSVSGDADVTVGKPTVGAVVKGVVRMEGSAGAKNGFVQLMSRETGKTYGAQILDKGEFQFGEPVMPGKYELTAGMRPDARASSIAATGARVVGQMVEIGGAGTVQLSITMREGLGTVNGTVLRAGKPVPGSMVVLVPQDTQNNLSLVRRDQSDLDGTFTLGAVVPGKYTVVALTDGWNVDWMNGLSAHLKAGAPVDVVGSRKYDVKVGVE